MIGKSFTMQEVLSAGVRERDQPAYRKHKLSLESVE